MSQPSAAPEPPTPTAAELKRRRMLEGPILPHLLAMSWPTMVQMAMYSGVLLLETWFIGKLGVDALAGASLVTPASFLMQAMAAGGLGGAVSAIIARAAGSGDIKRVESLAWHALAIAALCGIAFAAFMLAFGPSLYRLLGGEGAALRAAIDYSDPLFLASPLMWIAIIMASILRGLGVVKLQAVITAASSILLVPLSPLLIFGAGPVPAFGIQGAAIAVAAYYALVAALYFAYLASPLAALRLRLVAWRRGDAAAIYRLGGISSLLAIQSHITALIITAFAGSFGTATLAGFGAAIRLQHLVEPFIFSLGTATVVSVATCVGAGDIERARRIAVTAVLAASSVCGVVGILAALFPAAWIGLFSQDAAVIAAGSLYLRAIGPVFWCLGLGLVLYYCAQGIGRMRWTYAGSALRLAIVAAAGSFALLVLHADAAVLYRIVAVAMVASCAVTLFGVARIDWPPLRRAAVLVS